MDDPLLQRMMDDRRWLARQMETIPVFKDYLDHASIWEADKMVREELARRLALVKRSVNEAVKAAGADVRAGARLAALDTVLNRIDRVVNKVRFADYGHSALMAKIKIGNEDLARLLAEDRGLFEQAGEVEAAAGSLGESGPAALDAALGVFEQRFDVRKQVLIRTAHAEILER